MRLNIFLNRWKKRYFPFFPASFFSLRRCLLCGSPEVEIYFCLKCLQNIIPKQGGYCSLCGEKYVLDTSHVCSSCLKHPPPWTKFGFGVFLTDIYQKIIYDFKFQKKMEMLNFLVDILENAFFEFSFLKPDIVMCIPMSKNELRARGFNQSLELAKGLCKRLHFRLKRNLLLKIKDTLPQRELDRKERKLNVKGCFAVKQDLQGKSVLLIDDIYTTGATCFEASKVLKQKGARTIQVLVLARTLKK